MREDLRPILASARAYLESKRLDWAFVAPLLLILAVAGYLRFRNLGSDSIWRDEAATWYQVRGSLYQLLRETARDNYPPLHNVMVAVSIRLFGASEWALRLPSAVLGVLNIPAIYWVGRLVGGRTAGLIAALLLALSGFHIWFSQEARVYALFSLTATLFAGTSLRMMVSPTRMNAVWVAVSCIGLLYSHPYGTLTWFSIVIGVAAVIAWRPEINGVRLSNWLFLQLGTFAIFLPWAWILSRHARRIAVGGFWIEYPTPEYIFRHITDLATGLPMLVFVVLAAAIALLPQAGIGILNRTIVGPRPTPASWMAIILAWAIGPTVLGVLASVLTTPVFYSKYVIGSLPALLVLAGVGLSRIAIGRAGLIGVLGLTAGVASFGLATGSPAPREDWRSAAPIIAKLLGPSDCLVVWNGGYLRALSYYHPEPIKCVLIAANPSNLEQSKIPSNRLVAVFLGGTHYRGDTLNPLPNPPWQMIEETALRHLNIVVMARQ